MGGFSGDVGGPFGGLGPVLAGVFAAFEAALAAVVDFVVQVVDILLQAFQIVGKILGKVGNFFAYVWQHGISKLISGALGLIQKVHQFLEAHLAPVIKFLKRVRSIVDRYYKLYLKPYLNLIQKMRRYLAILKLLHIKWAQQLDARLAKTEQQLTRIFLDIRGSLNMVLNTVEAMTDPRKLSRWVLASVAGRRVAAATVRAFTGLPLGHFAPSNAKDRFAWEHPPLKLADYSNPRFNPPPSVIMAGLFTGPSLDGTIDPDPPDDATLDAAQPLDYFDDIFHSMFVTDKYFADPSTDEMSIVQTVEQQDGLYIDAAGLLSTMVGSTSA
jgi:hypothetical protein